MKNKFVEQEFSYDGTQLRSLFGYLDHGVLGDSAIAWTGPCSISFEHMVDGEDLLAESPIAGSRMVHFIIEKFHLPLFGAVTLQRLLTSICLDYLREKVSPEVAALLRREGDDLFFRDGKLSISIATLSPVSALIHFAINCSNEGTPVKTACLADLQIEPKEFAYEILARLTREVASIEEATMKVKWVR